MSIGSVVLPDVITSSQTWTLLTPSDARKLLARMLNAAYPGGIWQRYADRDDEWSGTGEYRLQIRINRPEGRPLYSLKWEGVP